MGTTGTSSQCTRPYHQLLLLTPYGQWSTQGDIKEEQEQQKKNIIPLLTTTITTPTLSPTITAVKLTAIEIIEEAITHHLNLQTPPPSPQPTMPLPTFPLTIAIPSPQDSAIHINNRDPSPFTLRQPLPDSTLDFPINFNQADKEKENKDPNDLGLPFFPNNPTSHQYYPLYI